MVFTKLLNGLVPGGSENHLEIFYRQGALQCLSHREILVRLGLVVIDWMLDLFHTDRMVHPNQIGNRIAILRSPLR